MTSTRDNPGAFRVASPPTLRGIASRAVSLARRGTLRLAALGVAADAANLVMARLGGALPMRFRCPCCGHETPAFRHLISSERVAWNSACASCDSRSRHRGLALLLPALLDREAPRSVLHFAPEPILRRYFAERPLRYETADLYLEDAIHRDVDLQQLPFEDSSYDMVVCNHVLEHVPDDKRALRELARVLTERGTAVITVPGDFSRRETVHFHGELPNGHYRDYGLELVNLLEQVFAKVEVVDLHRYDAAGTGLSHGIRERDLAFICRRAA
ncbi:MAG: class I SAM-dependent methyltransferase [Kofleriaceae bacterium]|nr:class I SAM-dependent methyltransferase [Kofleriaceae bacterium]